MSVIQHDIVEFESAYIELDNMLNEAWTNGYIDGYITVIRKESNYSEHRGEYEGRMQEEYECGYLSAIQDDTKWIKEDAWDGMTDGMYGDYKDDVDPDKFGV